MVRVKEEFPSHLPYMKDRLIAQSVGRDLELPYVIEAETLIVVQLWHDNLRKVFDGDTIHHGTGHGTLK